MIMVVSVYVDSGGKGVRYSVCTHHNLIFVATKVSYPFKWEEQTRNKVNLLFHYLWPRGIPLTGTQE
jgi:hypothetical protein